MHEFELVQKYKRFNATLEENGYKYFATQNREEAEHLLGQLNPTTVSPFFSENTPMFKVESPYWSFVMADEFPIACCGARLLAPQLDYFNNAFFSMVAQDSVVKTVDNLPSLYHEPGLFAYAGNLFISENHRGKLWLLSGLVGHHISLTKVVWPQIKLTCWAMPVNHRPLLRFYPKPLAEPSLISLRYRDFSQPENFILISKPWKESI